MSFISTKEEQELTKVLKLAGEILLKYWPGKEIRSDSFDIKQKSDGSFVTNADFESNELIINALKEIFPNDGILSEEIPFSNELLKHQRIWVLDPLDGTKSFIDGNDDFSISLSLTVDGDSKVGFIYFPARNEFCVAQETKGSLINGACSKVSNFSAIREESIYFRNFEPTFKKLFYPRWIDSGCALINLSRGNFDGIILKLTTHREWDLAAPAIAIMESGGQVSDENGNQIKFNKGKMDCGYFVASNTLCHGELLNIVKEIK